jgi:pyruvate/2-oxoglutarate dehydrogenase complex dihydrolipoamide dehydrogenase (E3) component
MTMSASNVTNTDTTHSSSTASGTTSASDLPPLVTERPPRVLIAGGGLGGLFLGILLEKAGIPYEIFERSPEIKPLGMSQIVLVPSLRQMNKGTHFRTRDIKS